MARRKKKKRTNLVVFVGIVFIVFISSLGLTQEQLERSIGPFLVFCIVLGVTLGAIVGALSLPIVKGMIGEKRVSLILKRVQKKKGGYIINDVILPGENGRTSQIDHILFTTRGIFVIETKNYAGRIYGKDSQREWTQVLKYGSVKNKLYNPVMQNKTHIYRLLQIIGKEVNIHSCIVFVRGNIEYIDSYDVFDLRNLYYHLRDFIPNETYSEETINSLYQQIIDYKLHPIQTNKEHKEEVLTVQRNIKDNICPRCGGKLVERVNKKTNSKFWGCSNYPKCKFIRK